MGSVFWELRCERELDQSGWSVKAAGDVNGDGIDDVVIGAYLADLPNKVDAGISYVIFGRDDASDIFTDLQLTRPTDPLPANVGFRILGATAGDRSGWAVSAAGDVNGDGVDDIIIGVARIYPQNALKKGTAYVIFGRDIPGGAPPFGDIQLTTGVPVLAATVGFCIVTAATGDEGGSSVSNAGDVNNDGIDDVIVGSPYADLPNKNNAGISYVIFGRNYSVNGTIPFGDMLLPNSALLPSVGFRILGASAGDCSGGSVSGAGDVNGDGVDDVIIGANLGSPGGINRAGISYVIFGRPASNATQFGDIELTTFALAANVGFRLLGVAIEIYSGSCVSAAGDVNADGIGDIIVSVPLGDRMTTNAGISYIIFGRNISRGDLLFGDITLYHGTSSWPPNSGFRVFGARIHDSTGYSVSAAGDVNGDGVDDIILGAHAADPSTSRADAGISYVIFGRSLATQVLNPFIDIPLPTTTMSTLIGNRILGAFAGDFSGRSVSAAGDVNGDGFGDLIVGAPQGDPRSNTTNAGITYVIYGAYPQPTQAPTTQPTRMPTQPTVRPTAKPTCQPTRMPTALPSSHPSSQPSTQPSSEPSHPSSQPTTQPSTQPSSQPSTQPSSQPSSQPSRQPSSQPSNQPGSQPSSQPSNQPSSQPRSQPSNQPSSQPSRQPTITPSTQPSSQPSSQPTIQPSTQPSSQPTVQPSAQPSSQPSSQPSRQPTIQPSTQPSSQPTVQPSTQPSSQPTVQPSAQPSTQPSSQPSSQPTIQPSAQPSSSQPSSQPTIQPSAQPSTQPSSQPSSQPTIQPSTQPSSQPTIQPSAQPSSQPSRQPTIQPSSQPSTQPSRQPSRQPSSQLISQPSSQPSSEPSSHPSNQPRSTPTALPSTKPSAQPTIGSSYHPTVPLATAGEWVATWSERSTQLYLTTMDQSIWACGIVHSEAFCTTLQSAFGTQTEVFSTGWASQTSLLPTKDPKRIRVSGRAYGDGPMRAAIAVCLIENAAWGCAVTAVEDTDIAAGSYVPYGDKLIYVGTTQPNHLSISIVDVNTNTMRSFIYTSTRIASITLLHVDSTPVFSGGFVAGTCVSVAGGNCIYAGMVRSDSGVMTGMLIAPASGGIGNSAELVNAMVLEYGQPDSFIAGGLELGDGAGMQAYVLCVNTLYRRIKYGMRYIIQSNRRTLMGDLAVTSAVKGLVLVERSFYQLVNLRRSATGDSVTVLQTDIDTGSIIHQVHILSPNASISCSDMRRAREFLVIACQVLYTTNYTQTVVISTGRDLLFSMLPGGFVVVMDATMVAQRVVFRGTFLPLVMSSDERKASHYTLNTSNTRPDVYPALIPTALPTTQPSSSPSAAPSVSPQPTSHPSSSGPTNTYKPTVKPTYTPTTGPSVIRSTSPSKEPSQHPSVFSSTTLSAVPSQIPASSKPAVVLSTKPTRHPTLSTRTPTQTGSVSPTIAGSGLKEERMYQAPASLILGQVVGGLIALWCLYQLIRWCWLKVLKVKHDKKRVNEMIAQDLPGKPRYPIFSAAVGICCNISDSESDKEVEKGRTVVAVSSGSVQCGAYIDIEAGERHVGSSEQCSWQESNRSNKPMEQTNAEANQPMSTAVVIPELNKFIESGEVSDISDVDDISEESVDSDSQDDEVVSKPPPLGAVHKMMYINRSIKRDSSWEPSDDSGVVYTISSDEE